MITHMYKFNDSSDGNYCLSKYKVLRETPKGFYIAQMFSPKKWVSAHSKNGFAFQTEKEALNNYIERKKYQVCILTNKLEEAKYRLNKAQGNPGYFEG